MAEPIVGKVAAIESDYSVVINRGANDNVKKGMIFAIEDPKGREIRDPDSDELLGHLPVGKIKVKVFDVQDRFCRAETFNRVKAETAYEVAARELLNEYRHKRTFRDIASFAYPNLPGEADAKLRQALQLLQLSAAERSAAERPAVVEVNVGDVARQAS
ncbi:hypothetical protein [Mycobacterium marinum]|uniref:hypothetical protein n=1 Tax=Mycobacterium marinum TaxID=1781 RepID=UPI000EEDEDBF|nr:hypothetical protein [Mycobacterium marinum]RFZ36162.1 hypothetical protein KST_03394 [Mycobacterium marinum]GJO06491.1 hypothetical protein NJB1808e29_35750 [Mycobacterium marinum]GJP07662.1 hypothetical protein NJB18001_33580 [Mycobacterium marinum]GJP27147.1 hypothetical protein NJB1808_49960 [Mycobacterium marinum]